MAIWGGDGSTRDQAVICNTFEDLKTLLEATEEGRLKYKHIALDDSIPVGDRIMDLRKEGWYTNYINIPYDSSTGSVYLYGNNWIILGPSILSGSLIYKNWYTVLHINNLTIKNAYVYANGNNSCVLSGSNYHFEKCKFSATLDGSTNNYIAYFMNKGTTSGRIEVYQCSFNLKLHKFARLHDYLSFNAVANSLFNFESSYSGVNSSESYSLYGNSGYTKTLFTKLTGNIKFTRGADTNRISFQSNSGYNVVDINFSSDGANHTVHVEGNSSSVSIWNTERCGANITPSVGTSVASVTTADMVNKNYLESIDFLVGDTPTL